MKFSSEIIDHVHCSDGMDTKNSLDPCTESDESFVIAFNSKTNKTHIKETNMENEYMDYCLIINDDLTYSAKVCRKKKLEGMQTEAK